MKSSYSLFSQKFVNGKFRTSSVSGDKSSHSHIDMKNIITSKSNSSSNRGEKSNDEYTEVHSENKYFEIFHESNPLKLQLGRMNEMSKISNSINFSYYKLK